MVFTFNNIMKNLFLGKLSHTSNVFIPMCCLRNINTVMLFSRVKKEHSIYIKKMGTGEGCPPNLPIYTTLTAAAADLMEGELECAEKQYDGMAPKPEDGPNVLSATDIDMYRISYLSMMYPQC